MKLAVLLLGLCAAAVRVQAGQAICESYVVAPGDSLDSISQKFGVRQDDLNASIQQCDPTYQPGVSYLQANMKVCLPPYYPACAYVRVAGNVPNCKYYIIQGGDTLESIALALGLAPIDLQALNPEASMLQVNQFVKLTGWTDNCPAPGDNEACRVYVVDGGDSLSTVALAFSVDLAQLVEVNPSLAGDTQVTIQPGTRIAIPPFTKDCGDGVPVPKPVLGNCNGYTAAPGDTLFTIAAAFQTTTDNLVAANPSLAEGVLSPGTLVYIPPYTPEDCVNGVNMVQLGQIAYDPSLSVTEAVGGEQAPGPVAAAPAPAPAQPEEHRRSRRLRA